MPWSKLLLSRLPLGGIRPQSKTSAEKKSVLLAFSLFARLSPFSLKEVLPVTHPWLWKVWQSLASVGIWRDEPVLAAACRHLPQVGLLSRQISTCFYQLLSTAQNPTEITFLILSLVKMMLHKQGT